MGGKLPPFAIADTDGTPTIWQPTTIYFPNGAVTDIGNGTVFVNTGPGGGTTLSAATPILIAANTIKVNTSGATSSTYWRGDFTWAVPPGSEVLEARTPLLKAGTILSINTDGNTSNFLRGDGIFAAPAGGIVYAPSNATYIVQTPDGTLTNEQALNQLVSGLVKNTSGTGVLSIATTNVDFVDTSRSVTIVAPLSGGGDLSVNRVIAILSSTASSDGYLKGADFATFNAKVASSRAVTIVAPLSGGGDLSIDRVISILSSTASSDGYLKSSDFALFNAKASTATTITVLSPLSGGGDLSANRIIALTTDGNTANFLNGAGVFTTPSGGSAIVYAPTGATYILQTNNAALASAQILAALSNGLLKSVSGTGVISIASGGVDFENLITVATPLLRKVNAISITTDGTTTNFLSGVGTYIQPYEARSPLLRAGSVLSVLTNATIGTFLNGIGTYTSVYEARSPLLSAGTVLSVLTDGTATNYLRGDGTYRNIYEARSPFLSAGTVLSVLTDGTSTNFLSGIGRYVPAVEARSPLLKSGSVVSVLTDGGATTYLRGDGTYRSVYEARSPLLSAGTVVSVLTSGVAKQYLNGIGNWGDVTTIQTSATLNLTATGEFGLDTTDDVFMIYNSTTGRIYAHYVQPASFCFAASNNTWINETLPICAMRSNMAVTISQVDVTVVGAATPTLTFQLEIRNFTGYQSAGIITTATANIVAQHTGTVITSFSNATIGARAALFITTGTAGVTAGTANFLMGTVYYTMNQE